MLHPILTELGIDHNSSICAAVLSQLLDRNIISDTTIREIVAQLSTKNDDTINNDNIRIETNPQQKHKSQHYDDTTAETAMSANNISLSENKNSSRTHSSVTSNFEQLTSPSTLSLPTNIRTRHVALQIYYDGGLYSGLAENVGQSSDTSIERALFSALKRTHLITTSREMCQYSRCGRTDKGVSACGQTIALQLKSAFPIDAYINNPATCDDSIDPTNNKISDDDLPKNSFDKRTVWVHPRQKNNDNKAKNSINSTSEQHEDKETSCWVQKSITEYAYDKILNNVLPPEIRVLGWCPVSDAFSARFSCTTRTYRYFFVAPIDTTTTTTTTATVHYANRSPMSIERMRMGLQHMIGTHDFRNFCKIDVEKVYNFVRTIHAADIVVTESINNVQMCYLQIVGQAFLWHQIRCIVHVLFLIGRGLEDPSVVIDLLDVNKHPGKPSYPLADEKPLVLHDCLYNNLSYGYSVPNLWNIICHQEQQWEECILAAARIRNCLNKVQSFMIRTDELCDFAISKLQQRQKKNRRKQTSVDVTDIAISKFASDTIPWEEAHSWLCEHGLIPDPSKLVECVYTPLLERSKGTTYEEKVVALNSSTKRHQKYEMNVIKKRKSKEEDAKFYDQMLKQGGSSA